MSVSQTLLLSGDCGIRAVRGLRDRMAAALHEATIIEIDCALADHADVAFVQLVLSAQKTARRGGKQIRLTNMPEAAVTAFHRAGLGVPDH